MPDSSEIFRESETLLKEAVACHLAGDMSSAEQIYKKVLANRPDCVPALVNLGNIEIEKRNFNEGLVLTARAIQLDSGCFDAYVNLVTGYMRCGRLVEARNYAKTALQIFPLSCEIYHVLGLIETLADNFNEATQHFECAIKINPNMEEAYNDCAILYANKIRDYWLAKNFYQKVLQINPQHQVARSNWMQASALACQWDDFLELKEIIVRRIENNEELMAPAFSLYFNDSPFLQALIIKRYLAQFEEAEKLIQAGSHALRPHPRRRRIKLGFYGSEFRTHPIATLIIDILGHLDSSRFELFAFSFNFNSEDSMARRLKNLLEHYIIVDSKSDEEVVELSRELEIDIAIDLNGYTPECRPRIFYLHAAPVQVNYLGFAGTLGSPAFHYIIGDKVVIPVASRDTYVEKVVCLPGSYYPNPSGETRPTRLKRKDVGLPEDGIVFTSFNRTDKLTPQVFSQWMRILTAVSGSVIWLFENYPGAIDNLKKEARKHGLDDGRIISAPFVAIDVHCERIQLADLFLDSFPYVAHTTAIDALKAGVPVLTRAGELFHSRVAASLLSVVDMPELITTTPEEYEAKAIDLATHPEKLAALKAKLAKNRLTSPLFNTKLYTKDFEAALIAMYERSQAGLPPDHIEIKG